MALHVSSCPAGAAAAIAADPRGLTAQQQQQRKAGQLQQEQRSLAAAMQAVSLIAHGDLHAACEATWHV
jgi:hypothetical protein